MTKLMTGHCPVYFPRGNSQIFFVMIFRCAICLHVIVSMEKSLYSISQFLHELASTQQQNDCEAKMMIVLSLWGIHAGRKLTQARISVTIMISESVVAICVFYLWDFIDFVASSFFVIKKWWRVISMCHKFEFFNNLQGSFSKIVSRCVDSTYTRPRSVESGTAGDAASPIGVFWFLMTHLMTRHQGWKWRVRKKKSSYEKSEKIVSGYLGARADLKVWCETEYCAKL